MAETWHNLFSNALLFVALPCVCFSFTLYTIVVLFQLLRDSFNRLLRIGGVSAVMFFVFWSFAMTNSGAYPTREDKERSRRAHAEADAELSLMGGLLVSGAAQPPLLDLSSALTVPAWKYGVYEDGVRVDFPSGWVFPFGTNHLASVEVMSWGEILPNGYSYSQIASFAPRLSMIPEISSFNYGPTSSNSYEFIWYNAHAGRIDGTQFDGRIELFRNGDILTVTNGVAVYKERELPSEWGDPSEDGFYGNDNLLPAGADSNAYYWVDLVVSNAAAKVKFAGDGASNYPDPDFVAKENTTNRVVLLIGKLYTVTCDEVIEIVAKSDEDINVEHISENEIKIIWPLQFDVSHEAMYVRSRATTTVPVQGGFIIETFPLLTGVYVWETNKCCDFKSERLGKLWKFSCQDDCYCTGCSFEGVFVYEGYRHPVVDLSCGCTHKEEPSATASISFSNSAVIFENCYTNSPNDIVPRRSTTNSLDITIYGGPFGGSAEIEFDDKGKLEYLTQEAIPRAISVAAEQTLELSFPFTAKEESVSEKDIKASLKFTEYFTSDVIESEDEMTAVRVEITPVVLRDGADHRHLLGVGERVLCEMHPWVSGLSFECESNGNIELHHKYAYYMSPLKSECSHLDVIIDGSTCFQILYDIIEPEEIIATQCEEIVMVAPTNTAGAVGMKLDLFVKPMTVSFRGISMMENAVTNGAPGEGFFSNEVFRDIWFHNRNQGAGVFYAISNDNFFFLDEAKFAIAIEPPWGFGRITWQIPISWAAREAQYENEIVGVLPICYTQEFEIFQSGCFRLTKHGYWVERHANGSRSRSQGVLYQ